MPETVQFYPFDATYRVQDGKAVINLFGKLSDNRQIIVIDGNFEPYFYVIPKDGLNIGEKLEKIRVENDNEIYYVAKTEAMVRKFFGKEVFCLKVYTNIPSAVPAIREIVKEWNNVSSIHEYDIPFVRR
ncbi:hypothetical protein HYX07_03695, partial [Candidatus Woesearchaeota archaeon]|nr:hypothetical protein [Candidatus Woesearchaeota archaeon]